MKVMTRSTVVAGVVGIVIGAGAMWFVANQTQKIDYVEGFAYANSTGDAIGLSEEKGGKGEGYTLLPQVASGEGELSTCMEPLKVTPVRLGIIHIDPQDEIFGRDVVVYVECTGPSEKAN